VAHQEVSLARRTAAYRDDLKVDPPRLPVELDLNSINSDRLIGFLGLLQGVTQLIEQVPAGNLH